MLQQQSFTGNPLQQQQPPMKRNKTRLSYIIKDPSIGGGSNDNSSHSATQKHQQGINALALAAGGAEGGGVLYSGARDSLINQWNLNFDSSSFVAVPPSQNVDHLPGEGEGGPSSPNTQTQARDIPMAAGRRHVSSGGGGGGRRNEGRPTLSSSLPSIFDDYVSTTPSAASNAHVASNSTSPPRTAASRPERMIINPAAFSSERKSSIGGIESPISARMSNRVSFERGLSSVAPDSGGGGSFSAVIAENLRLLKHSSPTIKLGYDQLLDYNRKMLNNAKPATLNQTFAWHGDWVNDLVLCNKNRHLISCSSDRSILLWNTNSSGGGTSSSNPIRIGMHGDYVKRLAQPSMQNWVASGGLDRQICLWDLAETRSSESRVLFSDENPSASVYSLATNPSGSVIASGTPEKFIRIFDPRLQNPKVQKLLGHSDNVKDLLVSEDGKWILSASSDTTVKLWSLAMTNHCVTTFNYSESPIWCLATNSPTLDTFWAGAKDGWVYKFSCSPQFHDVDDSREVDCIALCKETKPVLKIAGIENSYIWTATTASSINRWPDVSFSPKSTLIVPDACICRRDSIDDPETESIYSKTTVSMDMKSEPMLVAPVPEPDSEGEGSQQELLPLWPQPCSIIEGIPGIRKSFLLNNKRHLLTIDSADKVALWDILKCVRIKELGMVDFDKACENENMSEWVCNWCTIDTKHGDIMVHLEEGRCFDSEVYFQDIITNIDPKNEDQRVNLAKWLMTYLFFNYMKHLYPNNSSFRRLPPAGPPTLLLGGNLMTDNDNTENDNVNTPSMNVSLASPALVSPRGFNDFADQEQQHNSPLSPGFALEKPSTSPTTPPPAEDLEAGGDVVGSAGSSSKKKNAGSFMEKFKSFRLRSPSTSRSSDNPSNNDSGSLGGPGNSNATKPRSNEATSPRPKEPEEEPAIIDFEECPDTLKLDPNINLVLSVEESNSIFVDTFRGRICDLAVLDQKLPDLIPWAYNWIVRGEQPAKDTAKLSFILTRHPKSKLSDISADTNRLNANRMLRVRKVIQHISTAINIELDPVCIGSPPSNETTAGKSPPLVFMELYCNGKLMNPRHTLATIKYVLCKSGSPDIALQYLEKNSL